MTNVACAPALDAYVRALFAAYRRLAGPLVRPRRDDRQLAATLHARGIPFGTVEAAMLLAVARRRFRSPAATPLAPIRSLHYFLPVLQEILRNPLDDTYIAYLRRLLRDHPDPGGAGDRPENDVF